MKKVLSIGFVYLLIQLNYGQVGINTQNPESALDIVADNSGILIPRMTASQIESIALPTESELVFSTTNSGTTVNGIGFWYYDGATWKPIIANSSGGVNIYNSDGILTGNRIVTMNNHNLNIGPDKFFINGADGNIGIMTNAPIYKLDINGGMRVRSLNAGNVFTTSQGILSTDQSIVYQYGDIRFSSLGTDHNGWYIMDGRSLASLPVNAQTRALALGISGTLPNATDKYIKQGIPGSITGSQEVTLSQQNMPNFTLNGTTVSSSHNHTLISPGNTMIQGTDMSQTPTGAANVWQLAGGAQVGSISSNQVYTTSAAGNHSHTITIPTGGTGAPIALNPGFIQLNYFIYLGI